jgi:DNA-directed RNA polymerase subunit RPC12/RpoP
MAGADEKGGSVLVQVCLECGREYYFEQEQQPEELACDRCGNTVFRSFHAERTPDEVQQDFSESTDRDLATDDPATDVSLGDLHDLNNL